jgi:IS5 family transposase
LQGRAAEQLETLRFRERIPRRREAGFPVGNGREEAMRPSSSQPTGAQDLFRSRLDAFIDMRHPLVQLGRRIDWTWLDAEVAPCFAAEGRPGAPTRFVVGLMILKEVHKLSDEEVCDRWVESPYFQHFTGEEFFRHALPHERSNLTHWRQRLGADKLGRLLAESLRVACEAGALKTSDLGRVTVDTTVQPKNITHPTDAKLLLRAIEKLGLEAKAAGLELRQSYARVAKRAALMAGRYAHAKQWKRMNRALKFLRTRLGRLVRDIRRKADAEPTLTAAAFAPSLAKAERIMAQRQNERGPKIYSWHAPETECIGKGKAHKPWEFGVKVTLTTTNRRCKGGQFILHAKALPGLPYDGHTLAEALAETATLTGRAIDRAYVDKGYRGHEVQKPTAVYISGQKRGVHGAIKRELRRRSAIEPVIGHMKSDGHLGRCYLKGPEGDAANAVLCAMGHNFRLVLAWLTALVRFVLAALVGELPPALARRWAF